MSTLIFSKWTKWENKATLHDLHHPGIYALRISDENVENMSFELIEEICYFGMTNSKPGLKGRLNQFNNSLHDKSGGGHGGAERFRNDYRNPVDAKILAAKLYVSVCPFECVGRESTAENLRIFGRVAMAEYEAFAKYVEKFKELPKYNNRTESKKYNHRKSQVLRNN